MDKFKSLMIILVVTLLMAGCQEPEDPTAVQIAIGEWEVENVIANGELNLPEIFQVRSMLHLDRNETFLFVNIDGRATAGTWQAGAGSLRLTGSDGAVHDYTIVYLTWEKMHVYRTLTVLGGEVELRYLFRRVN